MPTAAALTTSHVPPRLVVSRPAEDCPGPPARPTLASRAWTKTESPAAVRAKRDSAEWSDIEESPPRRKRSSKRKKPRARASSSTTSSVVDGGGDPSRYRPTLSQIQEAFETNTTSQAASNYADSVRSGDRASHRRRRQRDDGSVTSRRQSRHRVGSKRTGAVFNVNPSLLSVLSSLTRTSDRSSSSSNTVTQQSYDRRGSESSSKTPVGRKRSEAAAVLDGDQEPNVFDYMERDNQGQDGHSVLSSASSHYEPSDAGSSELPGTPSSQSTYPSPTTTREGSLTSSVAELRRRYDPKYASSTNSVRNDSHSPESTIHTPWSQPPVSHAQDDGDESSAALAPPAPPPNDSDQRSSSRASISSHGSSQRSIDRIQRQLQEFRQHVARNQPPQHQIDPVYGQHRSGSNSSAGSYPLYAPQLAMQQYQYPSSPAPIVHPVPQYPVSGHVLQAPERPPVPDAPDLNRKTIAGYELLAMELARHDSPVSPAYRKFEYLHHRILLHMQDELCEMEEQLRVLDEIAAQTESAPPPSHPPSMSGSVQSLPPISPVTTSSSHIPASRRRDAISPRDIPHQRTALLGRIFQKTTQYHKALANYNAALKDCVPVDPERLTAYREWMAEHAPLHASEARFLGDQKDLVVPGSLNPSGPPGTPAAVNERSQSAPLWMMLGMTLGPVSILLVWHVLVAGGETSSVLGRVLVSAILAGAVVAVVATTATARGANHQVSTSMCVVGGAVGWAVVLLAAVALGGTQAVV